MGSTLADVGDCMLGTTMHAYLSPSTEEDMYNVELANEMNIHYLSASTIKWTTLDPCTSLNECNSKKLPTFNFVKKIINIHINLQNQTISCDKKNIKKKTYF